MEDGVIDLIVLEFQIGNRILEELLLGKELRVELFEHLVLPFQTAFHVRVDGKGNERIDHNRHHKGNRHHLQDELEYPDDGLLGLPELQVRVEAVERITGH